MGLGLHPLIVMGVLPLLFMFLFFKLQNSRRCSAQRFHVCTTHRCLLDPTRRGRSGTRPSKRIVDGWPREDGAIHVSPVSHSTVMSNVTVAITEPGHRVILTYHLPPDGELLATDVLPVYPSEIFVQLLTDGPGLVCGLYILPTLGSYTLLLDGGK